MANDVSRADASRFAELISDVANDMSCWAGAHVFAILSHAGMLLAVVTCLISSPAGSDYVVPFAVPSNTLWATGMLGMIGAFLNFMLYQSLKGVNQPTALESPRQLYHKRQTTVLGGHLVLYILTIGDMDLAIHLSNTIRDHKYISLDYWVIAVIATIAVFSCFVTIVADQMKWFGQWRLDLVDSLQLQENQEQWLEDGLMGIDAPDSDAVDRPQPRELNTDDRE